MGKRHSRLVGLTWWGTTPGDGMLSYADEMWDAIPGRTTSFWEGGKTVMCWRVSGPAFLSGGVPCRHARVMPPASRISSEKHQGCGSTSGAGRGIAESWGRIKHVCVCVCVWRASTIASLKVVGGPIWKVMAAEGARARSDTHHPSDFRTSPERCKG